MTLRPQMRQRVRSDHQRLPRLDRRDDDPFPVSSAACRSSETPQALEGLRRMPIAQIIDMPGATADDYDQAFALIHRDGDWPAGQLGHIAGPTPDGFRVIDLWESREAFERFERDVLAPLGFSGLPRAEFPVHKLLID
jgi:hypothetical protein